MRLLFQRDLTPHPQYAAFYTWLQHTYQADAVLHFGMHGTVEWLPGAPLGKPLYTMRFGKKCCQILAERVVEYDRTFWCLMSSCLALEPALSLCGCTGESLACMAMRSGLLRCSFVPVPPPPPHTHSHTHSPLRKSPTIRNLVRLANADCASVTGVSDTLPDAVLAPLLGLVLIIHRSQAS